LYRKNGRTDRKNKTRTTLIALGSYYTGVDLEGLTDDRKMGTTERG